MTTASDVLIVGAGMAGAAAAWHLAHDGAAVTVVEREDQPGYHSTGRSAALFSETYGPASIRRLSTASRDFLTGPPDGFAEHALLSPRGLLTLATAGEFGGMRELADAGRANGARVEELDEVAIRATVPILREGVFAGGVYESAAMDIDVAALHQGFLRGLRQAGGQVTRDCEVTHVEFTDRLWRVTSRRGAVFEAPVLVNAAGAWADQIAALAGVRAVGLEPRRRTALMVDLPPATDGSAWPLTGDLAETFYFKPDAGRLLLSPSDATPVPPQDVQPEIEDVATVIERFTEVTTVDVERPGETWAGLRSFVADGDPVAGFAPEVAGFFWLAGQGGYGIQTAPAMGRLAAALVQGEELPDDIARLGLAAADIAPARTAVSARRVRA